MRMDDVKKKYTRNKPLAQLTVQLKERIKKLDKRTGGWIGIVRQSIARFVTMRGFEAAASMAYYALFSLFPLTLVLASLLGFIFRGEIAYARAIGFIRTVFPFSGELIDKELREIFTQMRTFGILGLLGLLWAASGYFSVLAHNINLAWPKVKLRGMVHNRLVALGMLGGLVILMLFSILTTTLVSLMPAFLSFIGGNTGENSILTSPWWIIGLRLIPALFTFAMFLSVYRWVPNKKVSWMSVLIGALIATLAWELARLLFTMFLSSGLARYQFIYGSLGALIALMVWIYFGNSIILFGAYLVATLDILLEQNHLEQEAEKEQALPEAVEAVPENPIEETIREKRPVRKPESEPAKGMRG